jgi:fluoride ion exporter CrcB/FEX
VRANEPGRALLNVAGSMALCLASAALGYVAVMRMWGG